MQITDEHTACFEAGIKFGALYHQFAGTPVSPHSATALSRAIESSIENQPYCTEVTVEMDSTAIASDAINGYAELTGRYLDVEVNVEYDDVAVTAAMTRDEDDYPRMELTTIEPPEDN